MKHSEFRVTWVGRNHCGEIERQGITPPSERAARDLAADLERQGATEVRITYRGPYGRPRELAR